MIAIESQRVLTFFNRLQQSIRSNGQFQIIFVACFAKSCAESADFALAAIGAALKQSEDFLHLRIRNCSAMG